VIRRLALVVLLVPAGLFGQHALARTGHTPAPPPLQQPHVQSEPPGLAPSGVGDTDHLSPGLHRAVTRAIAAARAAGVDLSVTSGWRSAEHQQALFDAAVRKYGSRREASHWVLPPGQSAHVRGEAVDVGPRSGATWLQDNGVRFGLCRRYDNEYWHFELLASAKGSRCPAREPNA
jgi:D-alanyl-D-alanine carboxypeptidase